MPYPKAIQDAIESFSRLPSIGPKTAERLVFYLLRQSPATAKKFAESLEQLSQQVKQCEICFNFSEQTRCSICSDGRRNNAIICVVAFPQDVAAIEKTADYSGQYHVLGGTIDTLDGVTPDQLHIKQLVDRVARDRVAELILALNPDTTGETTMLYLTNVFKQTNNLTITRLGRGLPIGGDVEYADEVTLSSALHGRQKV